MSGQASFSSASYIETLEILSLKATYQGGIVMLPETVKQEIISKILSITNPVRIILFGSHARGDATEASDIDILVVKDQVFSKRNECVELWRVLHSIPYPKDILVATLDEFEFYRKQAGSVFRTASQEGIEIYVR